METAPNYMKGEKMSDFQVCQNISALRKGELGEEAVYEALLKATTDKNSSLFGSRIIRNVYMPFGGDSNANALFSEADLIVCSDACTFVIEVKNRSLHVDISADATHAHLYDSQGNPLPDDPIAQNQTHVECVRRQCKEYPANRIFNVTVFVNPLSINGGVGEFIDTRAVVELDGLVGLLERKKAGMFSYLRGPWFDGVVARLIDFTVVPEIFSLRLLGMNASAA